MEWYEIVVGILAGLTAAIPLVIELVKYVKLAIKEKNWSNLVNLTMQLMMEAENQFEDGADKKAWVISMIQASAKVINYDVDVEQISALIDSFCVMGNAIGKKKEEVSE